MLGLKAETPEEGVESLAKAVEELMVKVNIPTRVRDCGIDEETYFKEIDRLALEAFDDQCTGANPRLPLVKELVEIYKNIY